MDRIQRGIAARIQHWIEAVEGGNALSNSDIRWLVGKEGLAAYQAEVSHARAERERRRRSLVEINDGNVPDYLEALDRAKAATVRQLKDGDTFKSKAKLGTAKHRDAEKAWRDRRANCSKLQEQVDEAWSVVDAKYHDAFHAPPEGGWGDKGAVIAELQWPPHLLKTQLEHRPEAHLMNVPLHQQRDLLVRELAKLQEPDPLSPSGHSLLSERAQHLRARAAS
jgi:hypothetical protein